MEINDAINKEFGNSSFVILVDELRDTSTKEQMTIVLRYVVLRGRVIEWFLGDLLTTEEKDEVNSSALHIMVHLFFFIEVITNKNYHSLKFFTYRT